LNREHDRLEKTQRLFETIVLSRRADESGLTAMVFPTYQRRTGGSFPRDARRRGMMRNLLRGTAALGLLLAAAVPASAQVVSDPTVIRSCLCEQQFVMTLQDSVGARRQTLEASQRSQASLANQVETRRAQINVYDNNELDAFKKLLQQRDDAIAATATATDSYDDAATRYNQAVAGYNAHCAGRSYDENVLHQAQATLSCPRP
jgi:hypothetical protein